MRGLLARRPVLAAALLAALAVVAAYQVRRSIELRVAGGVLAEHLLRGVYGGEGVFRWT